MLEKSRHDVTAFHACEGGIAAKDTIVQFDRDLMTVCETDFPI